MGIGIAQVDFLKRHAPLGRLCTMGVQAAGAGIQSHDIGALFVRLGASSVTALDVRSDTGAEIVHDLNRPIADAWENSFDTVLDAGTLEHVFDVPQALYNMAAICKVGGKLICINPANGWLHHGFYQFSPELIETFCHANGFEVLESSLYRRGETERHGARAKPSGKSLMMVAARKTKAVGDGNVTQARYRK